MKSKYVIGAIVAIIIVVAAIGIYWYSTLKPAENVLIVGTSADFPPYEYIDEEGNFAGFDVDLINLIAGRLGLRVEWRDMSFDILIGALKGGKIDAIIAAMSITSERQQEVDFSVPYYTSEFALLVRSDSLISITEPKDMIEYSIGTQTGSSQYEYLTQWIDTGELSEDKVFLYERFDQAVLDLVGGRIDIVFTERPMAVKMTEVQPVKVAYTWEAPSGEVGIAVPKGDPLLNDINKVINDLDEQGILDALVMAWLGG